MRNLFGRIFSIEFASRSIFCKSVVSLICSIAFGFVPESREVLSADESPLPAVKWIRSATESGALKVDFYDPQNRPKSFPGWTDFHFSLEYKFSHQTRWKSKKGNTYSVTIVPTFTFIEPIVTHAIQLPRTIDELSWHESALGSHELDHVAIGSHPRLLLLSTYLLKNMGTLNRSADQAEDVTQEWIEASITTEVNDRRKAIHQLIAQNNEKLDELTRHGGRAIRERDAFFDRLYLKENLDESKFRYLGESLKLLETEEYRLSTSLFKQR